MRTPLDTTLERVVASAVALFALWTLAVHLAVAAQLSYRALLYLFPALLAAAPVACWLGRPLRHLPRLPLATSPPLPVSAVGLALLLPALSLLFAREYSLFWLAGMACLLYGWRHSAVGAALQAPGDAGGGGRRQLALFCLLCAIAVALTLCSQRPDADDSVYLGQVRGTLDHPGLPLAAADRMLGARDIPLLIPVYSLHSYELLAGAVSSWLSLDLLTVYYLLLPAMTAVLSLCIWGLLLRLFTGGQWLLALGCLLALAVLLGEAHRSFGNFAFTRLFQGKSLLTFALVPLLYYYSYRCVNSGPRFYLPLLAAAQVAAVGLTSSGLFIAPMATGLAVLGALASTGKADSERLRNAALALLTLAYPVLLALYFKLSGHKLDVDEGRQLDIFATLDYALGANQKYLVLAGLLAAWAASPWPHTRRFLLAVVAVFLLLPLNPWLYQLFAEQLTSTHTFWRVFWAAPVALSLVVLLTGLAARVSDRTAAQCGAILLLLLCVALPWWQYNSLRDGLGLPTPKLGVDRRVLQAVSDRTPADTRVLAHREVSTWMPLLPQHPELLYSRPIYIRFFVDRQSVYTREQRRNLQEAIRLVNGERLDRADARRLAELADYFGIGSITLLAEQPAAAAERALRSAGFSPSGAGKYVIWHR